MRSGAPAALGLVPGGATSACSAPRAAPARRHPPSLLSCRPIHPCSVAGIVGKYGFGDGQAWMANWEAAWRANLDTCGPGPEGECSIH